MTDTSLEWFAKHFEWATGCRPGDIVLLRPSRVLSREKAASLAEEAARISADTGVKFVVLQDLDVVELTRGELLKLLIRGELYETGPTPKQSNE